MSTTCQTIRGRGVIASAALAFCVSVILITVGCSDAPAPAAPAKADAKAKASANDTNAVVYDVKSVFDDDPKTTKDPFFPKSKRRLASAAGTKAAREVATVADLHLRGVIGSPGRFIAMINDKTFATGEKSQVAVGPNQYLIIKVNKITERSVTVSVDGEPAPRELSLEPTQEAKK